MKSFLKGLIHRDDSIRGFCIHGLSENLGKIKDERTVRNMIEPLHAATLKSGSMKERDFAGLALRSVLRRTDDPTAVLPIVQSSLARLNHKDPTMRVYYAHTLHENIGKIEDRAVLTRAVGPLTAAALKVADSDGEGMSAAELANSALKQALDEVNDQTTLKSIIRPLAAALQSEHVKRRRIAAHTAMLMGHKVEDKDALAPLAQPLITAHFHDPDKRVRDSAGLALRTSFGRTPDTKK